MGTRSIDALAFEQAKGARNLALVDAAELAADAADLACLRAIRDGRARRAFVRDTHARARAAAGRQDGR